MPGILVRTEARRQFRSYDIQSGLLMTEAQWGVGGVEAGTWGMVGQMSVHF